MPPDNEIKALNDVYETLKGLDNPEIKRILVWVEDKFDLENQPDLKAVEREAAHSPVIPAPEPSAVKKSIISKSMKTQISYPHRRSSK